MTDRRKPTEAEQRRIVIGAFMQLAEDAEMAEKVPTASITRALLCSRGNSRHGCASAGLSRMASGFTDPSLPDPLRSQAGRVRVLLRDVRRTLGIVRVRERVLRQLQKALFVELAAKLALC
jgi:hypothetical protein